MILLVKDSDENGGVLMAKGNLLKGYFGLFTHYLYGVHGNTDWIGNTNALDIPAIAARIAETGASYYCITMMQGTRHMLAPNATYDKIAGTVPGEACALRDIPLELGTELKKYGIDLYLYYTGDGPHKDKTIAPRFDIPEDRHDGMGRAFVEKWADVLREYSLRYGDLVKGWWIDGCYDYFGYDNELLSLYESAIKAGNPDAMVALNGGVAEHGIAKYYQNEDFTCGERVDFDFVPEVGMIDGSQAHMLIPLGLPPEGDNNWNSWCMPGVKHDAAYLADYMRRLRNVGCALTIDVVIYPDGVFDPVQIETLRKVSAILAANT